ncbi:MAG: hypothetical protein V3R89_07040 [Thermoanaerobaculia bacterium]
MSARGALVAIVVAATFAPGLVGGLAAQRPGGMSPQDETRLLRSATSLESRGDFAGAERVLNRLLAGYPISSGALFALERVLRAQGLVRAVLPAADRFIGADATAATPRVLKLRVLLEIDSLAAFRTAAMDWIAADPATPEPYQEVARIYRTALGAEAALDVLRRGRKAVGDEALFAMEAGDLLVELDRKTDAVMEWSRAIGEDGAQASAVVRRIQGVEGDSAALAGLLVRVLGRSPTTVARRRAATRIALEVGLTDEALAMAREVAPDLEGQTRRGFLADLARMAEEGKAYDLALWAYQEQREHAADRSEARALDHRVSSAALASGDSATAMAAQGRVAESLAPGTAERRRALATMLRLQIAEDHRKVDDGLVSFRGEFPEAPELDELSVSLALRYQAAGDVDEAERLLRSVDGPRSAVERGYLMLAEGEVEAARAAFLGAAVELQPDEATEIIQLVGLLDRLSPDGVALLSESAVQAHRGDVPGALAGLDEGLDGLPEEDQAALLVEAARTAERDGDESGAAALRERVVQDFAEAPEAPEAILALARFRGREPVGVEGAIELLEDLILARPNSPVVPTARRELARLRRELAGLRGRIPGGAR